MGFAARALGIFLSIVLFLLVIKPTFAQEQTPQPTVPATSLHNYTQRAMIEVMSALICQIAGVDVINPNQPCLGIDRETGSIGFVKNSGGAIGAMSGLIAGTFVVPVHFSDYLAYKANSFGLIKKTYAQTINCSTSAPNGIGYCGLQPVLSLFTLFRNIAYVLFVFVFVIVGLAIMLRVRIDPRTVMTIQNQIPKLIVGLIMITFAYAIAGFLIDLMWISVYFIINTLSPATQAQEIAGWTTGTPVNFISNLFNISGAGFSGGGIGAIAGAAAQSINALISDLGKALLGANSCSIAPWDWGGCIANGFIGVIAWFIGVLAFLIFLVAIFVQLFKLWFALLKCFINVLLAVILAPFWILAGLIPGASPNLGWGGWLRNLAGNLAPFPAILFLFLIARTIVANFTNSTQTFNPPLLGNITGGGQEAVMYGALIAFGFILSAPSIVEQVRKAFNAGGLGGGIGGLGAGQALVGGFVGGSMSRVFRRDQYGGAIGPGAVWLAKRQNRAVRGFGRLMGWRNQATVREQAEERVRSAETQKKVREEARNISGRNRETEGS